MTTMRNTLRYALAVLFAAVGGSACTLDIPYENQLSDPSAITSVTTARELLASAYDRLPNPEFELSVLSDDFETTSLISRNSDLGNLYKWQTLPMTNLALTLWQGYYESIAIANAVLERTVALSPQNESEQANLAAVNAEAKALKAYCYFDLLRLFAPDISEGGSRDGVILKEQFELGFLPRSSIDACVSYIRTLLTEAVATENSPETAYWISQQGVRCLLAELELYAGQYEKAVEWANLVLTTAGGYDLFTETNYWQLWNGGAGPESLFSRHTTVPFYLDLRYDTEKGDFLEVSEDLAGSYDAEDLRGAESLYPKEFPGETVGETITMRCLGKYNRMNWDATEISCIHKLRTVTACFVLAEAYCLQGSHDGEARTAINEYLTRRKAQPLDESLTGDDLLRAILAEKQKEFVGEGERWFDLKHYRKGVLSSWSQGNSDKRIDATDYRWTLPIPQEEYFYNENVFQNEGWPKIEN